VRLRALRHVGFSRLVFFQMASENYNFNNNYKHIHVGSGSNVTHEIPRTCSGGTSKSRDKMYVGGPHRETFLGSGPWWVSFGGNQYTPSDATPHMLVGDRGLVVRTFEARLGGMTQNYTSPAFSILCDKVEIVPPEDVHYLAKGDFLEMRLEMITLPLEGDDWQAAQDRSGSNTLVALSDLPTHGRVQMQATSDLTVVPMTGGTHVESHYPVRICIARDIGNVLFRVDGTALGYTPIVICGLPTHDIPPDRGLWIRELDQGHFMRLVQGDGLFYQVNYDCSSQEYEAVFNVELHTTGTLLAFGTNPDTWTTTTAIAISTTTTTTTTMTMFTTSAVAANSTPTTGFATTSIAATTGTLSGTKPKCQAQVCGARCQHSLSKALGPICTER